MSAFELKTIAGVYILHLLSENYTKERLNIEKQQDIKKDQMHPAGNFASLIWSICKI